MPPPCPALWLRPAEPRAAPNAAPAPPAGGWQEQITCPHHARNLQLFAQMLGRIGFRQEHIEAFFAGDGQAPGQGAALGPRVTARGGYQAMRSL